MGLGKKNYIGFDSYKHYSFLSPHIYASVSLYSVRYIYLGYATSQGGPYWQSQPCAGMSCLVIAMTQIIGHCKVMTEEHIV